MAMASFSSDRFRYVNIKFYVTLYILVMSLARF